MDVRCARCGTEYDFDDALVSERGTTVKCTNCAYQFKVYPGGGGGAPERWIVRKGSGRELVYTSLRDLQRAIAQRQVGPADLLSRGGAHPLRQLGEIAELEPFFHAQASPGTQPAAAVPQQQSRTLLGLTAAAAAAPPPTPPPHEDTVPDVQSFDAARAPAARGNYQQTPAGGFAPVPGAPSAAAVSRDQRQTLGDDLVTEPRNAAPEEPEPPTLGSQVAQRSALSRAPERPKMDSFSDEPMPSLPAPHRPSALRWVVGLVVVAGLAFLGGTVGMRYVKQLSPPQPSAAPADDRVTRLLSQGDSDLSRGDFESAKEQYDKASALSEKNPKVLSALARLEAARADQHWLALKLIDPANTSELDAERAELTGRIARVQHAAELAASVADTDPAVVRARIDSLRLSGDVAQARQLVPSIGASASDPETAYVLAALDLAESTPIGPPILDRLRTAASTERGFGRAHGALIYALASSGALEDARAELARAQSTAASPLSTRLRAYIERLGKAAPAGSASALPVPSASSAPSSAAPAAQLGPGGARAGGEPGGGVGPAPGPGDFRTLLEKASAAKRSGDLATAESMYRAAQEQEPGNMEALAGLADIERARGELGPALQHYEAVLQQNPTYLPALDAAAGIKWQKGDRTGALALYRTIVKNANPGDAYSQRASARIAEAQGGGSAPTATAPEPAAPKPTTPPPSETPTNIDTSDLPGMK